MSILSIILIILAIFGIAVFFKVIKNVFKAAIYVFVLLAIVLFILGVSVYTDAADFRKNIQEKPITFMLVQNKEVIAGMKMLGGQNNVLLFNDQSIEEFRDAYSQKDFDKIKDDSYKVLFFNFSVLENMNNSFELDDFNLSNDDALMILKSENAIEEAAGILAEERGLTSPAMKDALQQGLEEQFHSDQGLKDSVFSLFVGELFPSQALYVIKGIKNKEIVIYPETPMFKALNYIPTEWVAKNTERGVED